MASPSTDPPIPLSAVARQKWDDLAGNKYSPFDLAAYCAAYGRWVEAEEWLVGDGHGPVVTIRDDKGNVKSHGPAPQLAVIERSLKEMDRLAQKLRLRPPGGVDRGYVT